MNPWNNSKLEKNFSVTRPKLLYLKTIVPQSSAHNLKFLHPSTSASLKNIKLWPAVRTSFNFNALLTNSVLLPPNIFCCRDDDDINDVASMAGVNLNEESARILATNSELVGTQIRSCKDEAFLHPGLLHRRILETGKISLVFRLELGEMDRSSRCAGLHNWSENTVGQTGGKTPLCANHTKEP